MSEFNISRIKKYLLFGTVLIEFVLKGLAVLLTDVIDPKYILWLNASLWILYAATFIIFLEILFEVFEHRSKIKEDVGKITVLGNESKQIIDELLIGYNSHDGTLAQLKQFMEVKSPEKYLGLLKEVSEPTLWELDNYIIGWNPNWSIELSNTNKLGDSLRQIQIKRLKKSSVTTIEYVFLEGYEVAHLNLGKFGSSFFLKFLKRINQLATTDEEQKGISNFVGKYRIWKVPKEIWENKETELGKSIDQFKNYIFIAGSKVSTDRNNLVFFINKPGFYGNDFHKLYLEIFDQNDIYDSLQNHFEHIINHLEMEGMKYHYVKYNESTESFELIEANDGVAQANLLTSGDGNQSTEPIKLKDDVVKISVKNKIRDTSLPK